MNHRGEINTSHVQEKMITEMVDTVLQDQTKHLVWSEILHSSPGTENMQESRSTGTSNPVVWIQHQNPTHIRSWCFPEMSAPLTREPQETRFTDVFPSGCFMTNRVQITQKHNRNLLKRKKATSDWFFKEPEGKSSFVSICSFDI